MAAPTLTHRPAEREATPPPAAQRPEPDGRKPGRRERGADRIAIAVVLLVASACLPLLRVFTGTEILRPILAAVLLSVGLSWAARRSGAGPVTGLAVSLVGFVLLTAVAFLPSTLVLGFLPTPETLAAARELWARGLELVRSRPAPVLPVDGLVLLTVTGVWWVAHVIEGMVFRLSAPLRAIGMALVLWVVPLAVAPETTRVWLWAVPLLAASALLLLVTNDAEVGRWGALAPGWERRGRRRTAIVAAGWPVAIVAIIAGVGFGGLLPGFEDPPWYELRGRGGTTLTTNPIVSIRSNLVSLSEAPIARVQSPRPVYLRLTALDVYGENEEWSSDGIRAGDASGRLPLEAPMAFFGEVDVQVTPQGLGGAVIVPVPYHPTSVAGAPSERFRFDSDNATVTVSRAGLTEAEPYTVTAAVPAPPADLLESAPATATPALTALPATVPQAVVELARSIVDEAGAVSPFARALAIQDELRTWTYSVDPPQGHGATAMESFLQQRIGYCEQYAGTMAVMLRSLGIPARVAVGYTPGDLVDEEAGIYQVRNANAHAWVEVRFDELGWIAFEPTPRTDGNVLVPDEEDLAPALTVAQEAEAADPQPDESPSPQASPDPAFPDFETFPTESPTGGSAPDADGSGVSPVVIAVTLLLLLVGLGAGGVALGARGRSSAEVPAEIVLDSFSALERIAEGLGEKRRAAETDAEFLGRLFPESRHGAVLATAVARARWARTVPAADAGDATRASSALRAQLLDGLKPSGRFLMAVRSARHRVAGRLAPVVERPRRVLRRLARTVARR